MNPVRPRVFGWASPWNGDEREPVPTVYRLVWFPLYRWTRKARHWVGWHDRQPGAPCPSLAATGRPHVAHTLTTNPQGGGRRQEDDYNVITHTLTADGADASEDGTGRDTPLVPVYQGQGSGIGPMGTLRSGNAGVSGGVPFTPLGRAAVRRLTPLECERLQGLPDGWTATSDGRAQADSPRYRQIGNSVAVPVVEWIARRIRVTQSARERAA